MKVIAICNGKGGVGKTTTTANLGAALSMAGKKVLLIDMDPQVSLTDFFVIDSSDEECITIKDLLLTPKIDPKSAIINLGKNLDIIPSNEELAAYDGAFDKIEGGALRLKQVTEKLKGEGYDYILIDTPPSLSMFTTQSLIASEEIIIPLKANDVDMKATEKFLNTVDIAKQYNKDLKIKGVVFTMVKSGSKFQEAFTKIFKGHELEKKVYKTKIRDTVKLGVSSTKGMHIFQFDPRGIGAEDYKKLATEVL